MQTFTSHSQEISPISSQPHFHDKSSSYSTEASHCTEDTEKVVRKKVSKTSKRDCGNSCNSLLKVTNSKESPLSTNSNWLTPVKQVGLRDVTNRDRASTLKKGMSQQLDIAFPPTVNKNKHAAKNTEGTQYIFGKGSQKLTKTPWFGKRNFLEFDDKEHKEKEEVAEINALKEEVKNEVMDEVKKVKIEILVEKKEESKDETKIRVVDHVYYFNHTRNEMAKYPVYLDKDLGYGQFVQETLRETEVDNDCQTDTDLMGTVTKWTMDDLAEGIKRHFAEKENDAKELEEKIKKEKEEKEKIEKIEKEIEAEERFKRMIEAYSAFDSDDDSDDLFGGYMDLKFVKDSKENAKKNSQKSGGIFKKILEGFDN